MEILYGDDTASTAAGSSHFLGKLPVVSNDGSLVMGTIVLMPTQRRAGAAGSHLRG